MLKDKLMRLVSSYILDDLSKECSNRVYHEVVPTLNKRISELTDKSVSIINIKTPKETIQLEGVSHEKFGTVLQLVNLDIPVYLSGEAGTGKNVICKQVAEALGLEFYFTNAVTQEYKLTGFIDASGHYHETQFYKAFKNGGLFFLDELDASIPEVLVILNAAIANRYFDFPTGKIEAHKDFRLIAAGNTLDTGADNIYSGRYCLDGASLDRFSIIQIPYSRSIEEFITNKDSALIEFCHAYREVTKKANINSLFSYRALSAITKLKGVVSTSEALRYCLVKGMNKDDLNTIKNNIRCTNSKYLEAFKNL